MVTYSGSHGIFFAPPPPPKFSKRNRQYFIIFYVHFRGVGLFVVFVVLLLKFGLKILIFTVTAIMREGCFGPPPLSHQEVIDAI